MKILYAVVTVALVVILGANALSTHDYIERAKNIPREQLKAEIRAIVSPVFKAAIDDSIINFIDVTVRKIILEGNADWGIPILDPLQIDHFDLNLNLDEVQLTGSIDAAQILEISTFVVDKIKANLLGLNVEFGFHVPEIVAQGEHYDIEGTLGDLIPVWGDGAFSASVEGITLTGKLTLGSNNSFIYVKSLDLDITLTAIKTHFEGLLGGGDLSDLANEIVTDMAPEIFENSKPTLIPMAVEAIINLANEKLDGLTLQDILDLINGGGIRNTK